MLNLFIFQSIHSRVPSWQLMKPVNPTDQFNCWIKSKHEWVSVVVHPCLMWFGTQSIKQIVHVFYYFIISFSTSYESLCQPFVVNCHLTNTKHIYDIVSVITTVYLSVVWVMLCFRLTVHNVTFSPRNKIIICHHFIFFIYCRRCLLHNCAVH